MLAARAEEFHKGVWGLTHRIRASRTGQLSRRPLHRLATSTPLALTENWEMVEAPLHSVLA
jgi:hypothetical protein